MTSSKQKYDRKNPFIATIKERYSVTQAESKKCVQHLIIDLGTSGIKYEPGDALAVIPENNQDIIKKTIKAICSNGKVMISNKRSNNEQVSLEDYLLKSANITKATKKLITEIATLQKNQEKKNYLTTLLLPENKLKLQDYINNHEIWDLLNEHQEVNFSPQDLCNLLNPLTPRFYSIASSMKNVGNEVHLAVSLVTYKTNSIQRYGTCSNYLCNISPTNQPILKIYLQPNSTFKLPNNPHTSIIMVGPGVGVAPFRAFMQERIATHAQGKNWLFFGDWTKKNDFYYSNEWTSLVEKGSLHLNTAFSRDQEFKIYVQDKIYENAISIWKWIQNGASFYICGDASRMARDVDATLKCIVQEQGKMSEEDAKAYVQNLIKEKTLST